MRDKAIKINLAIVTLNVSHEAPTIDDDLVEISARRTRNSERCGSSLTFLHDFNDNHPKCSSRANPPTLQ